MDFDFCPICKGEIKKSIENLNGVRVQKYECACGFSHTYPIAQPYEPCECAHWARTDIGPDGLFSKHHPNCPKNTDGTME